MSSKLAITATEVPAPPARLGIRLDLPIAVQQRQQQVFLRGNKNRQASDYPQSALRSLCNPVPAGTHVQRLIHRESNFSTSRERAAISLARLSGCR